MDFIPLTTDKYDLGGAASSDGEGHEDEVHGDSDDDEDLNISCIGSLIAACFLFSCFRPTSLALVFVLRFI